MRRLPRAWVMALLAFGLVLMFAAGATADPVVDAVGDSACAPTDAGYNAGNGVPSAVYPAHNCLQKSVSDLVVNSMPDALLDLGDNQYNNGELGNYETVYNATLGRANAVVYPSLGNAEYANAAGRTAAGFFGYFGPDTGVLTRIANDAGNNTNLNPGGYYSFSLGAWHIIALNSNCADLTGGCGTASPEEKWLKADLAAHRGVCTLAYWHHPRWNSGTLGNNSATHAFWDDLYAAHADIALGGHANHHYERFVPQDNLGNPTPDGIREFIVSTGGQSHGQPPTTPGDPTTSVLTNYSTYGILQLTLRPTSYDWQFIPANGTFTDSGAATCHSASPPPPPPPPSFPVTPVLDTFAQAPGALSSNWQSPALQDAGVVSVPAGGTTAGSTGTSSSTWKATSFNANQQAYLTVPTLPAAGHFLQVGGRVSTLNGSTVSLYFVRVTPSTGVWELRKKLNGAGSTSMGTFTAPFAAGDSIGLNLNGATITAYHEAGGAWSAVGSVSDTSIAAGGYLTFSLGDTTARGGAFGGGNAG